MTTLPVLPLVLPPGVDQARNGMLDPEQLVVVDLLGHVLEPHAAASWAAMTKAAARDGVTLAIGYSYRDYATQEALFRARYTTNVLDPTPDAIWIGKAWWLIPGNAVAAVPGRSNHGLGVAVDVAGISAFSTADNNETLAWLLDFADQYGWSWEIQSEPWHIRYVGGYLFTPGDDMTLEEFAAGIGATVVGGKVCVALLNDPPYANAPIAEWGTTLYPLADAIRWTHEELKRKRLGA